MQKKIAGIFLTLIISILLLLITTMLFDLEWIALHISRCLIVWFLLIIQFVFYVLLIRAEIIKIQKTNSRN